MLNAPIVLYLGSRGLSAAGNLLAVAIFTRLAGRADYGEYLLIFAWALIVYGFTAHWMRFAYFGVFQSRRGDEYVVSLAGLLAAALAVVAVGLTVVALCGFFTPIFLLAVFSLICGMTVYEAASEVTRTRLDAAAVALGMVVRTCLTIVLGSFALWFGGGPTGLAFAIALAHLIGAAPCLRGMLGLRLSHASRVAVRCRTFDVELVSVLRMRWPAISIDLASPISAVIASSRLDCIPPPDRSHDPKAPSRFPLAKIKTDGLAVPLGLTEISI